MGKHIIAEHFKRSISILKWNEIEFSEHTLSNLSKKFITGILIEQVFMKKIKESMDISIFEDVIFITVLCLITSFLTPLIYL